LPNNISATDRRTDIIDADESIGDAATMRALRLNYQRQH
jgi:hypothetical protein